MPPRELLQLFFLLLVFMQQAETCCRLLLTPPSLFQTELLSSWVLADAAAVTELEKQEQLQLTEEGEKKNRRRLVLQSWLFMLPSSASPGASAVVCSTPGGEPGAGVRVGSSGYEKSLDAWWEGGIHLTQAKLKFGDYTQREKTSLILTGSDQFYSRWASDVPKPVRHLRFVRHVELLNKKDRSDRTISSQDRCSQSLQRKETKTHSSSRNRSRRINGKGGILNGKKPHYEICGLTWTTEI